MVIFMKGAEFEVLKQVPWEKVDFEVLMIELQHAGKVLLVHDNVFDGGDRLDEGDHDNVYDCDDKVYDDQAGAFRQGHHHNQCSLFCS